MRTKTNVESTKVNRVNGNIGIKVDTVTLQLESQRVV